MLKKLLHEFVVFMKIALTSSGIVFILRQPWTGALTTNIANDLEIITAIVATWLPTKSKEQTNDNELRNITTIETSADPISGGSE